MNSLFKLRKNMAIPGLVPFKYLLYAALLTKVTSFEPEDSDEKFGVFSENISDLYDYFPEFNSKTNSNSNTNNNTKHCYFSTSSLIEHQRAPQYNQEHNNKYDNIFHDDNDLWEQCHHYSQ